MLLTDPSCKNLPIYWMLVIGGLGAVHPYTPIYIPTPKLPYLLIFRTF